MATANFYVKNAGAFYAVNFQEWPEWEVWYEDVVNYFEEKYNADVYSYGEEWVDRDTMKVAGVDIEGKYFLCGISVLLRMGYYEGACFDYDFAFYDAYGYEIDLYDKEEVREFLDNYELHGKERQKAWREVKSLQKKFEKLVDELEKDFKKLSQVRLRVAAKFSNGETIYESY